MKTDTAPTTLVTVVSEDTGFLRECRSVFGQNRKVSLTVIEAGLSGAFDQLMLAENQLFVLDVKVGIPADIESLYRLKKRLGDNLRVVVVTENFPPDLVRTLVRLQISEMVAKPVSTSDFVRACNRAWGDEGEDADRETRVISLLPAAGGVGNTTLALQTAFILMKDDGPSRSTCVVDLNLQNGSCAEYLDLEPLFDISEVDSRPDRLDSQLLNLMLAHHSSGLAILSAPADPAEMRVFQPELIMRILDLVSAHYDNVVIDLPLTWFPWTPHVLLGSDQTYIVAQMTVPCLRNTQRMLESINKSVGQTVNPKVIINRTEPAAKNSTLKSEDIHRVLADAFAGMVSNNYRIVRAALDKGVPIEEIQHDANIIADLRAIVGASGLLTAHPARSTGWFGRLFNRRQAA